MLGVAAFVFLCYSSSSVGAHVADMDFARVRTYTRMLLATEQKCDEDHVGDWKQNTGKVYSECVLQDDGKYSWVVRNCKPGDHKPGSKVGTYELCVIAMRGKNKGKPDWDEENECLPKWDEEKKMFVRSIFRTDDAIPSRMTCSAKRGQKWKKETACKKGSTNSNGDTCNSYGFYSQCGGGTDPKFVIRENYVYECSSDTEWKYKEMWEKECDHNRAETKEGKTRFCVNGRWGEWKNINLSQQ